MKDVKFAGALFLTIFLTGFFTLVLVSFPSVRAMAKWWHVPVGFWGTYLAVTIASKFRTND
jgi:hypothetical protein